MSRKILCDLRDISFSKCPPSETMRNMALCFQRSKLMTWWLVVFFLLISDE